MTDQHRATPEQWDYVDVWGVVHDCAPSSCILELRARVEALEAAQLEQAESHRFCTDAIVRRVEALEDPMTELRAASADLNSSAGLTSSPGGLVERIEAVAGGDGRTALRAVADWIQDRHDSDQVVHTAYEVASWLRIEADRG